MNSEAAAEFLFQSLVGEAARRNAVFSLKSAELAMSRCGDAGSALVTQFATGPDSERALIHELSRISRTDVPMIVEKLITNDVGAVRLPLSGNVLIEIEEVHTTSVFASLCPGFFPWC